MNLNPRTILIAVIIVIAAMFLYPPFQILGKDGITHNMGYGWIFDPPKRGYIAASVNISMLMSQWIGVLLLGTLFALLNKFSMDSFESKDTNQKINQDLSKSTGQLKPRSNVETELKGVGGWLKLLIIGMTVISPLMGAGYLNSDFIALEKLMPDIVEIDKWIEFKRTTWLVFLLFAAISVYGGLGLAKNIEWSYVNKAILILWVSGPIGTIVIGIAVPIFVFGDGKTVDQGIVGAVISSIIGASIWTAYLKLSKRVKNTYVKQNPDVNVAIKIANTETLTPKYSKTTSFETEEPENQNDLYNASQKYKSNPTHNGLSRRLRYNSKLTSTEIAIISTTWLVIIGILMGVV